jgi:hypothetical protein
MRREARLKLKCSLLISLLAGNLVVETGSTTTASATNNFDYVVLTGAATE